MSSEATVLLSILIVMVLYGLFTGISTLYGLMKRVRNEP